MNLHKLTVAIPETRQRDLLANMLKQRGATVLQIPLVAIHDHPDETPVLGWLRSFLASPPDLLILLTGEGLRRLLALAQRHQLEAQFVATLARVEKLCRGPKPERALHELALRAELSAQTPTTAGVIATLSTLQLAGKRVAVQLYGEEPNRLLTDFLLSSGAQVSTVAPYVYASKEEEERVAGFIQQLAGGGIAVVAFTSQSQLKRLQDVAKVKGLEAELQQGMRKTVLAAVGPVIRQSLEEAGYKVEIMPERVYFMKPLVAAIEQYFSSKVV